MFLLGGALEIFSQQIVLKGKIVDAKTGELLSYATLALLKQDSTFVKGGTSDDKGDFSIAAIAPGDYWLSVSYLGYANSTIKLENLSASIDMEEIYLQQDSQLLNEVVVQANSVINKVDRQIILPRQNQIKASNSGYELLNNLMIPGLHVDPIQNAISAIGGGSVQVRINNIRASVAQVKAIRPADVLRVEYIDDPGVRYADEGVSAIVNFIVKQLETGVSIGIDLQNAPFVGFGNDGLSIRANNKKSVFGFDYYLNYRNYKNRFSDKEEKYLFPNYEMERTLNGAGRAFGYADHAFEVSYNLTEPEKYVFNAILRDNINHSPNNDFYYTMEYKNPDIPSVVSDLQAKNEYNMPSLDLYYQLQLPEKQSISINTVGTLIQSNYSRSYSEQATGGNPTVYAYSTDGNKYSFIGEGLYEKELAPFKWTSGLKYSQSYTENQYTGSTNTDANLHNASLYAYSQIQGKLKSVNYLLGIGISRSLFRETKEGYTFYTIQPNLSLSYLLTNASSLRYQFSIIPLLPSLSGLSNVRQDLDDFRINSGNPNLKPYRRYRNRITYQYQKKLFTGGLYGTYNYYKNPIMDEILREDNTAASTFIYTQNNQKKYQHFATEASIQYGPIKDIVSIIAQGGMNRYLSEGNNYYHQYTNWYGAVGIQAYYKNWIFYTSISTRENSLYGETINMGEASNNIGLFYTIKNCRVGLSMLYPYSSDGWKAGSEVISDITYSKSWTYIRENAQMLLVNFSWSIEYGRKHQSGSKKLNNSDTDSGIVK
ncbi:MAG: carboxypeptidase-like regulatory domain-containing protein [Dysgonamonadaceae bacterium]|jgi:hypothetical protein|nr:carboxypeptidase-like regulatory domain-containing protein [Dysgonamonadaceae bacterium]